MVRVQRFFTALLAWVRSSQARREAEILYLRQQLIVPKRSAPVRPRLKTTDRLIFVCLYRLFPSLIDASIVFKPETLLRWPDHVLVMGEAHLRRILRAYADYYNRVRTHLALDKDAPLSRPVQAIGSVVTIPLLGGLHHKYGRMA